MALIKWFVSSSAYCSNLSFSVIFFCGGGKQLKRLIIQVKGNGSVMKDDLLSKQKVFNILLLFNSLIIFFYLKRKTYTHKDKIVICSRVRLIKRNFMEKAKKS